MPRSRGRRPGQGGPVPRLTGVGVYVTARDYMGPLTAAERAGRIDATLALAHRDDLLTALTVLNRGQGQGSLRSDTVDEWFLSTLTPEPLASLRRVLAPPAPNELRAPRVLFTRQGILGAIKYVVTHGRTDVRAAPTPGRNALALAGMLVHLIVDEWNSPVPGFTPEVARELVRNQLFNQVAEPGVRLALSRCVWLDYAEDVQAIIDKLPSTMVEDALGAGLDEVLALVFALWVISTQDVPGAAEVDVAGFPGISQGARDAVLRFFATTPDELAAAVAANETAQGPWGILPIVERPLLQLHDRVVVMDPELLIQRTTTGLYWFVHDHQKAIGGNRARNRWAQAWGMMVERLAEDLMETAAHGHPTYGEEYVQRVYGGKVCDLAMLTGRDVVLAEVFSGSTTVATRFTTDQDAFERDLKKMVLDKAEQLDSVANALQRIPVPSGAILSRRPSNTIPIIVEGSDFPVNVYTASLVHKKVADAGLLRQQNTTTLAVMGLGDVELLGRLVLSTGKHASAILRQWRREMPLLPFSTFVGARYAERASERTPRTQAALDALFDIIQGHLEEAMDRGEG